MTAALTKNLGLSPHKAMKSQTADLLDWIKTWVDMDAAPDAVADEDDN